MTRRDIGRKPTSAFRLQASGSRALTLVESLVAISILVIAVFGPMSIVAQSIRTAYLTRDQMTAFYLAQEAVEYVRNVKDQNSLRYNVAADWLTDLDSDGTLDINDAGATTNLAKYELQLISGSGYRLVTCGATCPKLNVDRVTREYGPTTGANVVASLYTREITFWKVPGDDFAEKEIVVQVVMRWAHTGHTYEYVVRDYLKNWKITP